MVADYERAVREAGPVGGSERLVAQAAQRRGGDEDGWLAVFFEFWAHVVRRPELRERFANIHDARARSRLLPAIERLVKERGISLPVEARQYVVAVYAMTSRPLAGAADATRGCGRDARAADDASVRELGMR